MDSEDNNLEIITVPSSNPSHEQTPVAAASPAASSVPQDENRGLNEMTAEDLNSLKKQVYEYADNDRWKEAEPIFNKYAEMVRIPLTDDKETALHVAVEANSITFVKGLVNLMIPDDLEIENARGLTAFCVAAKSENSDLVQIMIEKNQNLPLIEWRSSGELLIHWVAMYGHHKIVQDLSSKTLLQEMDTKDIERLFFLTIDRHMFDVATYIFEEYPFILATAKYIRRPCYPPTTTLEMLLRQSSNRLVAGSLRSFPQDSWSPRRFLRKSCRKRGKNRGASWGDGLELLEKVWLLLTSQLEMEQIVELIGSSSLAEEMTYAFESGNVKAVECLLSIKDIRGQNILHCAVRHRQSNIVSLIPKIRLVLTRNDILRAVDVYGNSVLHYAAYPLEKEETSSTLTVRATTKMTSEVEWFKQVEKNAPPELRTMRNNEEKTPKEIFREKHKNLSREVKDTAKGIAESGMLVAALVATVAFAAALTAPGDKTNPSFTVFILANAAALLTSSASILSFLSNFTTSKFADSVFVIALHPSLILGLLLLFISIVTMLISFGAATFLIFEHTTKWAAYVVASMGVFPILLFLLFQFSIFDELLWSRFYSMP